MLTIKIFLTESGQLTDLRKDFPLYQGQYNNCLIDVYVPLKLNDVNFAIKHYLGLYPDGTIELDDIDINSWLEEKHITPTNGDVVDQIYVAGDEKVYKRYVYDESNLTWVENIVTIQNILNIGGVNLIGTAISIARNGAIVKSKPYAFRYIKDVKIEGVDYALYERKLPREFTYFSGNGTQSPKWVFNLQSYDVSNDETTRIITSQMVTPDVLPSTRLDASEEIIEPTLGEELQALVNEHEREITDLYENKQDKVDTNLNTNDQTVVGAINELKNRDDLQEDRLDVVEATVSEHTQQIALKQDKIDPNLITNDHSVVGAINELKRRDDDQDDEIVETKSRVSSLETIVGSGEYYVGTKTAEQDPSASILNSYVFEKKGRTPKGNDVVIYVKTTSDATDKNYKCIYNGEEWVIYELPPMEKASNSDLGIIKGSGTTPSGNNKVAVNVVGGAIENIYVKDNDGESTPIAKMLRETEARVWDKENANNSTYGLIKGTGINSINQVSVDIADGIIKDMYVKNNASESTSVGVYLRNVDTRSKTNEDDIDDIKDGTIVVKKAEEDENGNNIVSTYMTQSSGATKTYVKDYALPKEFNVAHWFDKENNTWVDTRTELGAKEITSSAIGYTELFNAIWTIGDVKFDLAEKNGYSIKLNMSSNADERLRFHVLVQIRPNASSSWFNASSYTTGFVNVYEDDWDTFEIATNMESLIGIYHCEQGYQIKTTVSVFRTESASRTFKVSNETRLYINTTSYTVVLGAGVLGEEEFLQASLINEGVNVDDVNGRILIGFPSTMQFNANTRVQIDLDDSWHEYIENNPTYGVYLVPNPLVFENWISLIGLGDNFTASDLSLFKKTTKHYVFNIFVSSVSELGFKSATVDMMNVSGGGDVTQEYVDEQDIAYIGRIDTVAFNGTLDTENNEVVATLDSSLSDFEFKSNTMYRFNINIETDDPLADDTKIYLEDKDGNSIVLNSVLVDNINATSTYKDILGVANKKSDTIYDIEFIGSYSRLNDLGVYKYVVYIDNVTRGVVSVNGNLPNSSGNVEVTEVPFANNLLSPDNIVDNSEFTYRTSGGTKSVSTGDAQILKIEGNSNVPPKTEESFTIDHENGNRHMVGTTDPDAFGVLVNEEAGTYTLNCIGGYPTKWNFEYEGMTYSEQITFYGIGSAYDDGNSGNDGDVINVTYTPATDTEEASVSTEVIVVDFEVTLNESTFKSKVSGVGGTYTFTYDGNGWHLNGGVYYAVLSQYGITLSDDHIYTSASIEIVYVAKNYGAINGVQLATFEASGFNQFNPDEKETSKRIDTTNSKIISATSDYALYVIKVVKGIQYTIYKTSSGGFNIATCDSLSINSTIYQYVYYPSSALHITPTHDYIIIELNPNNTHQICVHPTWSGYQDSVYEQYVTPSTITLTDAMFEVGMYRVADVYDEINFETQKFIKRIDKVSISAQSRAYVEGLGTPYLEDNTMFYYIKPTPTETSISISGNFVVNDFGTEEFTVTSVAPKVTIMYGQNLRDKLRTDVLTISPQTLTPTQQTQVKTNLGISSGGTVLNKYTADVKFGNATSDTSTRTRLTRILQNAKGNVTLYAWATPIHGFATCGYSPTISLVEMAIDRSYTTYYNFTLSGNGSINLYYSYKVDNNGITQVTTFSSSIIDSGLKVTYYNDTEIT